LLPDGAGKLFVEDFVEGVTEAISAECCVFKDENLVYEGLVKPCEKKGNFLGHVLLEEWVASFDLGVGLAGED
jgi:precorrin isomerase